MKRAGFTMIELIFVIVILGILAAVAVPKLAATRDDAKNSSLKSTIQTAISAVPAKFTAAKIASFKGAMTINETDWVLSNNECNATFTDDANDTIIMGIQASGGNPTSCLETATQTDSNLTLVIVYNAGTGTSNVGVLVNQMDMNDTNITFGGSQVVY